MSTSDLDCGFPSRRAALLATTRWNGIDYVEIADDQLSLLVYFFGPPPRLFFLFMAGRGMTMFWSRGRRR